MKDLRDILRFIFRETFEGIPPGKASTYYVQGKEGVFEVFDRLSAEQASVRVDGKGSSVYAHLAHLKVYLSLMPKHFRGDSTDVDWEATWAKQECTQAEWASLSDEMRREFDDAMQCLLNDNIDEDRSTSKWVIAQLSHAAYHLGAVRALVPLVS